MKSLPALFVYVLLVAGIGLVVKAPRDDESPRAKTAEGVSVATTREKSHQPTPAMLESADKAAGAVAVPCLADLTSSRPLVLVFVKDGCPCSEAAQPFLNALRDAYGDRANFAAVFDGDGDAATRWAKANHARFTMLPDPSLELVRRYGVENSLYIALVSPGGKVAKAWPGYSAEMLQDLGHRLGKTGDGVKRILTFVGAPDHMYSGCPY
jgi:peroxiredoxin